MARDQAFRMSYHRLWRVQGLRGLGALGYLGIFGGSFPEEEVLFWGSRNKGHSTLWSILGSPYIGKVPYRA